MLSVSTFITDLLYILYVLHYSFSRDHFVYYQHRIQFHSFCMLLFVYYTLTLYNIYINWFSIIMTFLKHSVENPQVSDYDQIKLNNKPVILWFKLLVNLSWNQFLYFKIPMKSNKIHFHFFCLKQKNVKPT